MDNTTAGFVFKDGEVATRENEVMIGSDDCLIIHFFFLLISLVVPGHLQTLTWQPQLLSCSLELHLLSTGLPRVVTANPTDDL